MSGTRSSDQVVRNGAALLLAYAAPRVFTLAAVVIAARVLGAREFGAYGAAAAFAVILAVVATLGMLPLLVREIARAPGRAGSFMRAGHLLKTGTNAVMLACAAWGVDALFPDAPQVRAAAMVLCAGWALNAYAENVAAYYQAVERMARWTQASALFGVVSAVSGVALLLATGSMVAFCWAFVAGWGVALAWLASGVPSDVRAGPGVPWAEVRALLAGLAPFALAFVGLTVYSKADVLLLTRWSGAEQVGLYSAAYKFVDVFQALVIVAAGAVYPRLARTAGRDGETWGGARSTELIVLGSVPTGLVLHLVGAPAVHLLYGAEYADAAVVLRTLALLLPLLGVSILGGYVLGAAGRMRPVALLYGGALAANLALNRVLIPTLGAEGAALARLGSEALLVVGFVVVLDRVAGAAPGRRAALAAVGVGAVAALTLAVPDPTGGALRALALIAATAMLYARSGLVGRADLSRWRAALGTRGAPARQGAR